MNRGWLIVFAKAPRAGLVKTRFAPPLSLDEAAKLYEAMLADVLVESARAAAELDLEAVLAFYPEDGLSELLSRTPSAFRLQVQRGNGLAERMANAFAEAAASGAPYALLRGSDSPALDRAHFCDTVDRLKAGDDLVLTPDLGGGYAMIGQATPNAAIFDVPMSTGEVLAETIAIANQFALRHSLTQPTFDLDTVADLPSLDDVPVEISSDLCPRTVEAISNLRESGVL